jgi:hypothetical protein
MTGECVHGLIRTSCGFCQPSRKAVQVDLEADGPTVVARYPGECANCGRGFGAGHKITPVTDLGWVGQCCLEREPT